MQPGAIPNEQTILEWIEEIHARGIRRPGYPADRWAEDHCAEMLRRFGVENVRKEPVDVAYWEPRRTRLHVDGGGESFDVPCFALPFSAPSAGVEAELGAFDEARPESVRERIAFCDLSLLRVPPVFPVLRRQLEPGDAPAAAREAGFVYDPRGTLESAVQVLPFAREMQHMMEPVIEAGGLGFIGVLNGYPGGGCEYYVPYDGLARAIPGVWIGERDGARLRSLLAAGPVRARLELEAERSSITSYNIVGELPGADDEAVIIGTHHDGPWSSAVEDASGMALVFAQASYWSQVPRAERPHRLVFLINSGHMAGGAGVHSFCERHRAEMAATVLEIHLEHAAREIVERDGALVPSGEPEPRWWFTSRIPRLEESVWQAIVAEKLERSLLLTPDALAPFPTTDGGPFHLEGVPLVNYLAAPFYLFDRMDDVDKIDVATLLPLTRATIRIVEGTAGISARAMRAG